MQRIWRGLCVLGVAWLWLGTSIQARADGVTVVDTITPDNAGAWVFGPVKFDPDLVIRDLGFQFEVPEGGPVVLDRIDARANAFVLGSVPATFQLAEEAAGVPATTLDSVELQLDSRFVVRRAGSVANPLLQPGTPYWLVALGSSNVQASWFISDPTVARIRAIRDDDTGIWMIDVNDQSQFRIFAQSPVLFYDWNDATTQGWQASTSTSNEDGRLRFENVGNGSLQIASPTPDPSDWSGASRIRFDLEFTSYEGIGAPSELATAQFLLRQGEKGDAATLTWNLDVSGWQFAEPRSFSLAIADGTFASQNPAIPHVRELLQNVEIVEFFFQRADIDTQPSSGLLDDFAVFMPEPAAAGPAALVVLAALRRRRRRPRVGRRADSNH